MFTNRLRLKMRLQCDPTVIYGLGPDFNGNLTRANLRDGENSFNTYAHSGLPPTPICSFGRAALNAARQPEQHNLLYFVAQGDGRHVFNSRRNYQDDGYAGHPFHDNIHVVRNDGSVVYFSMHAVSEINRS